MMLLAPIVALAFIQQDSSAIPDTIAGKRLTDFITAFNTKDEKLIRSMVVADFAKSALKILSAEEWASRIHAATEVAPISVNSVLASTQTLISVRLNAKSKVAVGLRLDLEPDVPFGVVGAKMADPSELSDSGAPSKYSDWTELGDLASLVLKDNKLPGICVAYQLAGKTSTCASAGVKSSRRRQIIETDDRLYVGEIGKAMTATLMARMVELKKLSWQTNLGSLLPKIKMLDPYKSITIDQLMRHKSGLPQDMGLTTDQLNRLAETARNATDARKAYVIDVLSRPLPEGTKIAAEKANADYVVAVYALETLIGKSYEWLMQNYVFDPMKMTTALIAPRCDAGQVDSPGNPYGHMKADFGYTPYEIPSPAADDILAPDGASITCSIEDLVKFADFHLQGMSGVAKVLSADSYKLLHTPDPDSNQAFGWTINPGFAGGEPCQSISSTDGTFYEDLTIWPKAQMSIAAVTNAGTMRQPSPTLQAVLAIRDRLEKKG